MFARISEDNVASSLKVNVPPIFVVLGVLPKGREPASKIRKITRF